jgi:putative phosphoesterase
LEKKVFPQARFLKSRGGFFMLIAALGDIHGNLPALEAALAEIDDLGIQTIVNAGDSVVGFPWSNETIDLLLARNIKSVQGEFDRIAVRYERKKKRIEEEYPPEIVEKIQEAHENASSTNLELLAGMPKDIRFAVDGIEAFLCHGTPQSQSDSLLENDDPIKFRRMREIANAPIVICGRSHIPFSKTFEETFFVNPGSVGVSQDEKRTASFAIISTESEIWQAEIRSVSY